MRMPLASKLRPGTQTSALANSRKMIKASIQKLLNFPRSKGTNLHRTSDEETNCISPLILKTLKKDEKILCSGQCSSLVSSNLFLRSVPGVCLLTVLLLMAIPFRGIDFTSIGMTALGALMPFAILLAHLNGKHQTKPAVFAFTNKRVLILSGYPWRLLNVYQPTQRRFWQKPNSFSKASYDHRNEAITLILNRTSHQKYAPNPTINNAESTQEILSVIKNEYALNIRSKKT